MESLGYVQQDDYLPQEAVLREKHFRNAYVPRRAELADTVPGSYLFTKRCMDVVGSAFAITLSAIPMAVIALAIFLNDHHSPFFKQVRVTENGKHFTMYKFRTMCVDAEQKLEHLKQQNEADGPVFKMKDDPRITKVGKLLRKTSLDELPQFFNVLGGSMSLVGPRPPLPHEVEKYTAYQQHRLDVKGGITCYWQCSGRSNIKFNEWVELDLKYIRERSLLTDVKILFKTVGAVLRRDGAE